MTLATSINDDEKDSPSPHPAAQQCRWDKKLVKKGEKVGRPHQRDDDSPGAGHSNWTKSMKKSSHKKIDEGQCRAGTFQHQSSKYVERFYLDVLQHCNLMRLSDLVKVSRNWLVSHPQSIYNAKPEEVCYPVKTRMSWGRGFAPLYDDCCMSYVSCVN